MSCFWEVWKYSLFLFSFFFKLLKFIIVSFHLALILFVLKKKIKSFGIFLFIYIYMIWIHGDTICKSLKLIQMLWTYVVLKKPKMLLPRRFFADWFPVSRVKLLPKKKNERKKKCIFTSYIWLLLGFAVVVGRCACVNLL